MSQSRIDEVIDTFVRASSMNQEIEDTFEAARQQIKNHPDSPLAPQWQELHKVLPIPLHATPCGSDTNGWVVDSNGVQ